MARPPIISPWGAEPNEQLMQLAAQGVSIVKAAGSLNRSMSAVRIRARNLGLSFPTIRETRRKLALPPRAKSELAPYSR